MKPTMKKSSVFLLLAMLLSLFLLTACSDSDEESGPSGPPVSSGKESILNEEAGYGDPNTSWTILFYLCGTDLETQGGYASINLNEICEASLGSNINYLIEAGGTREWMSDEIPSGELTRLHVENGSMVVDETCSAASMGDADTLADFIRWGASEYPADRYVLVMWDHGGGSLFGICQDELYGGDTLSLKEIETALVDAAVPLELAGFDACLMSTLETAETFQGYAHYMVASEEIEPGTGWDYTKWLNYLSDNPGCSGKELGAAIVDTYMEKCAFYDLEDMATLSVCDLTKLPGLSAAFRSLSGELVLSTQDASDFQAVVQGAYQTESYGERSGSDGTYDMVDLGDLMDHTGGILPRFSEVVKSELANVVVHESHGQYRSCASGLSVFYPKVINSDLYETYQEITDNLAYLEYASIVNGDWDPEEWDSAWVDAYEEYNAQQNAPEEAVEVAESGEEEGGEEESGQAESSGQTSGTQQSSSSLADHFFGQEAGESAVGLFQNLHPVQAGDEKLEYEQFLDDESVLNLNITSGLSTVKEVRFYILFVQDEDNVLYLGSDTDLYADYDTGEFYDNFHGTWIAIGEEYVMADVIDSTGDYTLYSIPAMVNGEETNIRAVYDYNKEEYRVLGIYDGADEDTNLSSRNIRLLQKGDKIEFIFYSVNLTDDDAEPEPEIYGGITWSDDTVMEDIEMADGQFYYMFEIEDIFGNTELCDPVVMEISDGEIYAYEVEE